MLLQFSPAQAGWRNFCPLPLAHSFLLHMKVFSLFFTCTSESACGGVGKTGGFVLLLGGGEGG